MSKIRQSTIDVQVVTGGHPFVEKQFFAIFDDITGINWSRATTPSTGHDVVVFYDMPGLQFTGGDPPVTFPSPTTQQQQVFSELQDAGTGLVFMHHSVASWPAWEGFAELIGGRFHYQPAQLRGVDYPDSGYVFDTEHTIEVLDPHHPICDGLSPTFTLTDELYCFPVFVDDVVPLMRTTFPTHDATQFFSADLAIRGQRNSNDGWSHPAGSNLVAWIKNAQNSPLAYLQFGDGPVTYADPIFRQILSNAIQWAASSDARQWALSRVREW
ncbi:MAG: ThuA domain-containing protein [Ilumatobacteraceae bacterium]|nr:ThuA domain-containing protein [Ilumatobacteraceae bacterium]